MTKITTRNTKQEIIAAYNAATKELKALKAKGTAAPPASQKALPPSPEEPVRPKANGELSVADIIASLRSLTTSIGESASSLQSELTTEATELQRIREQASAVTRELQTLHGIEVSEGSLAELIARYAESNEKAAEELTAKREAFEKEMNASREAWNKEQEDHLRKSEEAEAERSKARERDAAEHAYELEQRDAKVSDERAQRSKSFEHELVVLREGKETEWTEREKQLAEREREAAELRSKAEAFEAEREAAVKKAEIEGMGIARKQTKTQLDLKTKDNDGVRRVFELKIESLGEVIAKQEAQIEQLSKALETARKQTTELAVKAIDGASNASSFEAIKEIALEQAKNTQKGK
ncbi:MAG: hypothetical protein H6712_27510 [Myxococcales bacterium]|nr:hypothetical protein [Myxococcales bacterium]